MALALAAMLAGRLGFSGIPIYIAAGIVLGPSKPFPEFITPGPAVEILADLGIVLLLFFLGLEFSIERLTQARRLVVVGGVVDLVVCAGAGLLVGIALLGVTTEAVIVAGLLYISSSGIISQALFDFRRLADDETDLVLGILVFEDLAIALFLGVAVAITAGTEVSPLQIGGTAAIVIGFVAAFLVASRYAHHLLDRVTPRLGREQLLLATLAVAIGAAAAAEHLGLSEAVGALLAGILLSGSEVRDRIEEQLLGLRDFAAAVFFFAFGLQIDLSYTDDVGVWLLVAVPIAVAAKVVAGFAAGRLNQFTRRQSLTTGLTLVSRGEFTIILAQLAAVGAALDPTFRDRIGPFAGLVVLSTAILGVLLMRESRRLGRIVFPSPAKRRAAREGGASAGGA